MTRHIAMAGALCASLLWSASCKQEGAPAATRKVASAQAGSGAEAAAKAATGTKVAKVIFVGKEKACDCTRTRVDLGWVTLKKALGEPFRVPVERLRSDADLIQVAGLRQKKAMVTLPAVYFLDAKGEVVKLLQGELKGEQVLAALGGR